MTEMDETTYGKVALKKFGAIPKNFHIFYAEWLGNPPWTKMKVSGAEFDNKNRKIPHTTMTTIVTVSEMNKIKVIPS